MTSAPTVLLLGGAHETSRASEWLARLSVNGFVFWADESSEEPLDLPPCSDVSEAVKHVSGIFDATHPFDTKTRAAVRSQAPHLPYARIWRAPWIAKPEDHWTEVNSIEAAVCALPLNTRVFAATGRDSLAALARHKGPVFLRQLQNNTDPPPDNCQYVFGAGPFDVEEEISLFSRLEIDILLCRNVGAAGSWPKLAAARRMEMPVIMLQPPPLPEGPRIATFSQLSEWIGTL